MSDRSYREIPFNYTSADDSVVVRNLLGEVAWGRLQRLRSQRVTGRSARLFMRVVGELFVVHRNPFILEELVESAGRRKRFFGMCRSDLETIARGAEGNPEALALLADCQSLIDELERRVRKTPSERARFRRRIGELIGPRNVAFDPFTVTGHATDATDWRLYLPFAVVFPSEEGQVAPLLERIGGLGYRVIPRGAGTGLTGGCVPVAPNCVIINTEKLNAIRGIASVAMPGGGEAASISLESGVVTENAMAYADAHGYVFATDPTSSWACTIGGNIAENAGGRTAVLWGTAIDNLLSFRIAMADGRLHSVRRIGHPIRKILPGDELRYEVSSPGGEVRTIVLDASEIRKPGLWKDITNKALRGLPGIQKEGTDGVITSADFILYRPYPLKATFCLEFFGESMDEAGRVITSISESFPHQGGPRLMALEHFDEEYVRAIGYKSKSSGVGRPKAVLLIDMVAHSEPELSRGVDRLQTLLGEHSNTVCFRARSEQESEWFWRDRKRLGAIARRTNAFKLNEDIVLPLKALADFARFVERVNLREERANQSMLISEVRHALEKESAADESEWFVAKLPQAHELCTQAQSQLDAAGLDQLRGMNVLNSLIRGLRGVFSGYAQALERIEEMRTRGRSRLIVIATHMHAGDGNIHVNIPVFSNDRVMMRRAAAVADEVMAEAVRLGGVVSGEHGIGFTKLKYLEPERLDDLDRYRREVDPKGWINPGKLRDRTVPERVFTPSFNLLELEARILQYGSLEQLSEKIAACVRCGRCKPNCCVFIPAENLFFHPRNKNLAIGSVIEALLYDAQRSHSTRFDALKYLESIADHCTVCHKCLEPCPVDIDTGDVSVLEREILEARQYKHSGMLTGLSLSYLESRSKSANRLFRKVVLRWGGRAQRFASRVLATVDSVGSDGSRGGHQKLLHSPLPLPSVAELPDLLPHAARNQGFLLPQADRSTPAVFYFPGCGSERLFSNIALASIYLLFRSGFQVVLPPSYLCCGFPHRANARAEQFERIAIKNTIIFSQLKEMLGYLDFSYCAVSCGTCKEALRELETIFGARLEDTARIVLARRKLRSSGRSVYYHAPCHDSLSGDGLSLLESVFGRPVRSIPHCCSQAGTLALSRPALSDALLRKKADAVREAGLAAGRDAPVITNCPSCLQGLGRLTDPEVEARHLVVELARLDGGTLWETDAREILRNAEPVTF